MKKTYLLIALASCFAVAGTDIRLAEPTAADLTADSLVRVRAKNILEMPAPHDPVAMSWLIDQEAPLTLGDHPPKAVSTEFWMEVDGSAFNEGIALQVAQAGALVRISPQSADAPMPDLADLVLVNGEGRSFSNGVGLRGLLDSDQMVAEKARIFSAGTAVFRIEEGVGAGELLLFADNIAYKADARYLVHVRENGSDVALSARTDRHTYLAGGTLRVKADMTAGDDLLRDAQLTGEVLAPDGRSLPISFRNGVAEWPIHEGALHPARGLWEVRVTATSAYKGLTVRRDLRTAFAVGEATARFTGAVETDDAQVGLTAALALEVGVAGRYEVRGILFGTDADGTLKPLAVGHSADWLEAGSGALALRFDADVLEQSDLGAPFVVRDLRLIHQNRMSIIGHRQEAFAFPVLR